MQLVCKGRFDTKQPTYYKTKEKIIIVTTQSYRPCVAQYLISFVCETNFEANDVSFITDGTIQGYIQATANWSNLSTHLFQQCSVPRYYNKKKPVPLHDAI
jgi:hypothetical protein